MRFRAKDVLLAREKGKFLTNKLQDRIRANLLTWEQGNVCRDAVSAAEDSELEAG